MSVNFWHVLHIDIMTSHVVQLIYDLIRNTDYLKFWLYPIKTRYTFTCKKTGDFPIC